MPEHTLPDALHPQQEDAADELQLRVQQGTMETPRSSLPEMRNRKRKT